MKLVLRAATALAILGLATPAFPCGENKMTTASSTTSADTKDAATKDAATKDKEKEKAAVAKSEKKAQRKTATETPQKTAATN